MERTLEDMLEKTVARMQKEVPGTRAFIGSAGYADMLFIQIDYDCPCGRISHLRQAFKPPHFRTSDEVVDLLKGQLRAHVRAEGSEPEF